MVRGIDQFRAHFSSYNDCYVLIGGAACFLSMKEAGLEFRATKDLDVVLSIEALTHQFVEEFWRFVRAGKYAHQQKSTGNRAFYRFSSPQNLEFPEQVELFSRKPEAIFLKDESQITPIPMDEEVSSLSAILLEDDCYQFIHAGKREFDGIPILAPEYMIPLKARAWLDLSKRQGQGEAIDSRSVKKHKNDICRLYQLIERGTSLALPEILQTSMSKLLEHLKFGAPVDLKNLGLKGFDLKTLVQDLARVYRV